MNVLTPTHAISLFPKATFVHGETYSCQDLSEYAEWNAPWMDKYRKCGLDVYIASDRVPVRPELLAWKRTVSDRLTWILPYKRTGMCYCLIPLSSHC